MILFLLVQVVTSFANSLSLSFQVPSNNSASFYLNDYCIGNNFTYSISGTYYDSSNNVISAAAPTICQRMTPTGYVWKNSSSSSAMLQDAYKKQIYHSLEMSLLGTTWSVITWNFTEFPSISQVATLEFDADLDGIYPFTRTSGGSFLLVLSYTEQNLTFSVVELQGTRLILLPNPITMDSWYDFQGADFQIRGYYLYVFVRGNTESSGLVTIYSMQTDLEGGIRLLANITSETIDMPELSPVRVAASGSMGFLCTSDGVIVLNLTGIEDQQSPVKLTNFSVNQGNKLLDCMAIDEMILISTQQGVFNMTLLLNFELTSEWRVLQSNSPIEEYDEGQVEYTMFFQYSPVGQVIAYYTFSQQGGATPTVSFQVLNVAAADIRQAIVLDEPTINFLNIDCSEFVVCNPAFTLYNYLGSLYAVFDSLSGLIISNIERNPKLTFQPNINGPYSYVGILQASELKFNFFLTALDINSLAIYQPEPLVSPWIQHYLGASDSLYTAIYFPMSSYFAGPNVTYGLSIISTDFDNVILTYPSIINSNQTLNYNLTSPSHILKVFDLGGPIYVGVLNDNFVQIYDCLEPNLTTSFISAVGSSQSGAIVTQFAFVTVFSTLFYGVLVESGINETDVLYDLYKLSDSVTPALIDSLTVQKSASIKLEGYNGYIYSLTTENITSIYVIELLQPSSDLVPQLTLKDPISSNTLSNLNSFDPVDFTSSVNTSRLYIYDQNVGLAYIDLATSTSKYELNKTEFVAEDGSQVSLAVTVSQEMGTWLYVTGVNLLYAFHLNIITLNFTLSKVFPVYQNCVYSSPTVANTYLALTCNSTQVYVFDMTVPFSSSLLSAFPILSSSNIALTALQSVGSYHLYQYTGLNLTRILIGQTGKFWEPSSTLFQPTPGTMIWGRFTFYFSNPINQSEYYVVLNLTASSGMNNEINSTALHLEVWNPGAFIVGRPENSSSILVKGEPLFYNEVTGQQLPAHYFEGLDVTFSVVINGNQLAPVYPSDSCDNPESFVCLTAKSTICQDCAEVPNVNCSTFIDDGSQFTYFATLDFIIAQVRAIDRLQQQPTYNVTEALNLTSSECYLLASIQRCLKCSDIVIGACLGSLDGVSQSFLLVLDISEPTYNFQTINFLVLTLEAAYIDSEIEVFASDGTQVFVYHFNDTGSPLGLFTMITAESLALSWLAPTSFQALNETFFVMGDLNNGVLLLRFDGISTFFIEKFITLEYGDNSVAALRLFTENGGSYLYVLSKGGYFSQFRLNSETFEFIMTVNPVNNDEEVLLTNVIDFNVNYQYVAYFVSVNGQCCVRILDLEVDWRSAAYTTTEAVASASEVVLGGNLQMISTTEDSGTLLVAVLIPRSVSYTVFAIQLATNIYVYKSKKTSANFTMQVIGSNVISKAIAPAFTVYFNSTDVDETDGIVTLHSDTAVYQTWWFWASIGFGLIVTFTAVALLLIKYYRRTIPKPREKSILLQPVLSYSSRFTSMNLSLL